MCRSRRGGTGCTPRTDRAIPGPAAGPAGDRGRRRRRRGYDAVLWPRRAGARRTIADALAQRFPDDAAAAAVAAEADQLVDLVPVEPLDRVVEALLRVAVRGGGKRVVNVLRPALLLEDGED